MEVTTRAGQRTREVFGGDEVLESRRSLTVVVGLDAEVESVEDL
jgi:hypothetical protein